MRILDRGVYEIFPSEFERGVPLKYVEGEMDSKQISQRPYGEGYGARVQLTARSVINCQQPRVVEDNAGTSDRNTLGELLADLINTVGGLDGGLTASSVPQLIPVFDLKITTDADGLTLEDLVTGTLDALGIAPVITDQVLLDLVLVLVTAVMVLD